MKLYARPTKTIRAALLIGVLASLFLTSAMWAAVVIPDTVTVATVTCGVHSRWLTGFLFALSG